MKAKILGLLAAGLLWGPMAAGAGTVTVWDTFTGFTNTGMAVGQFGPNIVGPSYVNAYHGIAFTAAASGYLSEFEVRIDQVSGTNDWQFFLHANNGGLPGSVLETFSLTAVNGSATTNYTVSASRSTLITTGSQYWLMAQLPNGNVGGWTSSVSAANGQRAVCDLNAVSPFIAACPNFSIFSGDGAAGAARILAETTVPEPGTLALLGFGLAGLGLSRRRNAA